MSVGLLVMALISVISIVIVLLACGAIVGAFVLFLLNLKDYYERLVIAIDIIDDFIKEWLHEH